MNDGRPDRPTSDSPDQDRADDLPPQKVSEEEADQVKGGLSGINALIAVTQQKANNANDSAL